MFFISVNVPESFLSPHVDKEDQQSCRLKMIDETQHATDQTSIVSIESPSKAVNEDNAVQTTSAPETDKKPVFQKLTRRTAERQSSNILG